jgi:hypothetical protein
MLGFLVCTKIYVMSPNREQLWRLSHCSAFEFVVVSARLQVTLWSANSGES